MFAIIETGGKQLLVKEGDTIFIEKIDGNSGDAVYFDKVLMLDKKVGKPFISGAKVTGKIEKQGKQKKLIIFRFTPKTHYSKKKGHRQPYTRVLITSLKGEALKATPVKKEVKASTATKAVKATATKKVAPAKKATTTKKTSAVKKTTSTKKPAATKAKTTTKKTTVKKPVAKK